MKLRDANECGLLLSCSTEGHEMAYQEASNRRVSDGTGWFVGTIVVLALVAIGYLVFSAYSPPAPAAPLASSTVKVETETGHGSGVYIGDGLILTAAHVVGDSKAVKLKTDDGHERDATVLWASKDNDVSLLRTSSAGISASPLSCAPVQVGQAVHATGNPLDIEFITTYGHIIGAGRQIEDWVQVVPVDMVVLPGMSGGPAFNDAGEVIGISVAVMTAPAGFGVSLTGLGMIVPSTIICGLLGRT